MSAQQTTPDGNVWKGLQAGTADVVRQLEQENARLRAAIQAFFDAPLPPGKHTTTGGTVAVSLAGMVRLQEALTDAR